MKKYCWPHAPQPKALEPNAEFVAGVLRCLWERWGLQGIDFKFKTAQKTVREILEDYPDPYEVAIVLLSAAERDHGVLEDVWLTLDVRAFGRLRGWIANLPDGAARYIYLARYAAPREWRAACWAVCYPLIGDLEDAAEAGDYDAAQAALESLKELLGSYTNPA